MSLKLIIENRTEKDMTDVLYYVGQVIGLGRISNNSTQYCYATKFENNISVFSGLNKSSDKITVTYTDKSKKEEEGIEWTPTT